MKLSLLVLAAARSAVLLGCLLGANAFASFPVTASAWTATIFYPKSVCEAHTLVHTFNSPQGVCDAILGESRKCDGEHVTYTTSTIVSQSSETAACAVGWIINRNGATGFNVFAVDPVPPYSCPAHSTQSGANCNCDSDYIENVAKNGCTPGGVGGTVIDIFNSTKTSICPWCEGNPIYPLVGRKVEPVATGMSVGGQPLVFTYDSAKQTAAIAAGKTARTFGNIPALGGLWESSLHRNLALGTGGFGATLYRGDGRTVSFRYSGGAYIADADVTGTFTAISDGYRYVDAKSRSIETYNTAGQLTGWADTAGNTLTFGYSTAVSAIAPAAGYLQQVTDNNGRSLSFSYILPAGGVAATDGVISSVSDSVGRMTSTSFDASGNLTRLTWPDTTFRQFVYENASQPWALTGVVDERGIRYSTFTYDSAGRALSTEHAGGVDRFSVSYGTPPQVAVTQTYDPVTQLTTRTHDWQAPAGVQLTRPNGETANASSSTVLGYPVSTGFSQPAGSGYGAANNASTFDAGGNLTSTDDFSGRRSCYAYDGSNRETVRVEGLATTVSCVSVLPGGSALPAGSRKTETSWHPDWRLSTKVSQPLLSTTTVYHGQPDPFNNNTVANCTTAANLPNGKTLPLPCKQVEQSSSEATGPVDPVSIDNSFFSNSLLLHGDGADGSTQMLDSSPVHRIVAPVRNSRISTAQSKFGGSSIFVPGTPDLGDIVLLNGDYTLPGDFTYEMWIRPGSVTAYTMLLVLGGEVAGQSYFMLGANTLFMGHFGGSIGNFNIAPAANVWSHIAFVRSGSSVKAYVNGVAGSTLTKPGIFGEGTRSYFGLSTTSSYFDDIRLTNGVARYTAAFTPPTAPFGNTSLFNAPDAVTQYTYDASGRVLTIKDTLNRTTAYVYYTATSFSGTAPNEIGHAAGDLQSVTNAAGHVTQFTLYDRAGRVRQMIDPKGVVTDTVYTPRGWTSSVTVTPPGGTARTTSYTYDNAGQLIAAALPDGTTLGYSYDAAHRLTGVTDAKGNSVTYTLDSTGNKTGEQVKDPSGNLQRNITRVYDALNRVQQVTGASN